MKNQMGAKKPPRPRKIGLTFIIDSDKGYSTRIYDKCDDFNFCIVNFLLLSTNIPSGPSLGNLRDKIFKIA